MTRLLLTIILMACMAVPAAAEKQVAITIDDLPVARDLPDSIEAARFRSVLKTFDKHSIKAFGFVIGSHIDSARAVLLDEFKAAGHSLANHTFTHPDLNSTSVDAYIQNIIKCDSAIAKWVDGPKYFRYPMLHQGPTEEKYNGVAEFLRAGSYINVPVSIDNDDWLFNKHYSEALKSRDRRLADSLGQAYLAHMKEMTIRFDSLALAKLGRETRHILLIHMNEINADYLDRLFVWYEEQGWSFIAPEEALADSLYRTRDTYRGANGTSWLLRF